jgi:hypothetical protein
MKNCLATLAAVVVSFASTAQTTLTLQPDAAAGKDAAIISCASCGYSGRNFGSATENCAVSWTKSGTEYKIRSLVRFDLASIPSGAEIVSATLSLYCARGGEEGNHFGFFGSNKAWIERVTSPWNENTVTWETQPATSSRNRVLVSGSTSVTQNYTGINVQTLVQEIVDDPSRNFGFMIRLQGETVYRKLVFASSDHPTAALRPKLSVVYRVTEPAQVAEAPSETGVSFTQILKIFPNPAREAVNIAINSSNDDLAFVSIYDLSGREMADQTFQLKEGKNQFRFETGTWPRGLYMVIVKSGGEMINERLLLE